MGISKTSDHIQIKIKMPNPSQEPPASSKAQNEDLKDMDVLCTFKIKMESRNLDHRYIKDQWPYTNQDQAWAVSKVKSQPAIQPAGHLSYNFCQLQLNWETQNLDHGCVKDQWSYCNQDQDAKPQSGTSSVLQSPKWWLKGHGCSLHLQNQDREQKFGSWVYHRPVIISKSKSRCQTPVRNIQCPPKLQMRTYRTWMFFAPSKSR